MLSLFLEVLPVSLLAGLIYTLYKLNKYRKLQEKLPVKKEIIRILFTVYVTGLISLTLLPQNFWTYFYFHVKNGYCNETLAPIFSGGFNFIPSICKWLTGEFTFGSWVKTMLTLNMLMFVPYGIFVYLISGKLQFKNICTVSLIIPLFIELFQPVIGRSFDIDDFILNSLGILVGHYLAFLSHKIILKLKP
ncbi:MAG: VanZ family protein [Ruminococcaceae bacterium]|nr:VanZ family protein [Oscillospiraceae bacterium]